MIENEPDPLRRIPTKGTAEVRAEIGSALRAARLKRGQSIEAVAQQTRISKRYLEALENDRFDEFPAMVYMRGFLKGYCDHLDISFDELWAKIQPAPPSPEAPAPATAAAAPAPAAAAPTPAAAPAQTAGHDGTAHSPAPAAPQESSSAAGAMIFAALLAVALGIWIFKDREAAAPAARPAANTPRALMPLPKAAAEQKVALKAVEDAWVRVAVDDAVVFEGRLPRGAAMEWKPSHGVVLRTTAASSLQLTVNGAPQTLSNPSADGEFRIDLP